MIANLEPRSPSSDAESERGSSDGDAPLPLDVLYGLLANERRRRTIQFLHHEEETTLGELAEHIASRETGKPVSAIDSDERKRAYICLYQCHLPKMHDADVVEFDAARKVITTAENTDELRQYIRGADPDGAADVSAGGDPTRLDRVPALLQRLLHAW